MLCMDIHQQVANGFQEVQGDGRIIDEGPGFPVGADFSPEHNQFFVIQVICIKECFKVFPGFSKGAFNDAFLLRIQQYLGICPFAQYEVVKNEWMTSNFTLLVRRFTAC